MPTIHTALMDEQQCLVSSTLGMSVNGLLRNVNKPLEMAFVHLPNVWQAVRQMIAANANGKNKSRYKEREGELAKKSKMKKWESKEKHQH